MPTALQSARNRVLVVGAGPYGCTVAQTLAEAGLDVVAIERRDHVAGNASDVPEDDHHVCRYGAHIFHTNDQATWTYVNRFGRFTGYRHYVKALAPDGRVYSLPFSVQTLYEVYGTDWKSQWERSKTSVDRPANLEEFCLSAIGRDLYELLVKGYTEKQWGRACRELPASIVQRLPIRGSWDTAYFGDRYQGMPVDGYTSLFANMLDGVEVHTGVDFFDNRREFRHAEHVFYAGPLDRFFGYDQGKLEYRSLIWEHRSNGDNQHCPVLNLIAPEGPTRTYQWSHFYHDRGGGTQTAEYPGAEGRGEPTHPLRDHRCVQLAKSYLSRVPEGHTFGGRLGNFQYYDMHQVIAQARRHADAFLRDGARGTSASIVQHRENTR